VTHPFHPLRGCEFSLVTYRHNWGENRAYFHDQEGRLVSLPAEWTSLVSTDPFVFVSGGRSLFRFKDLLELAQLVREAQDGERDGTGV
jgi:Family of unknown function (DUF5372)